MSVVCRGSSGEAKDVEESRRRDESVRNMGGRGGQEAMRTVSIAIRSAQEYSRSE